LRILFSVRNPSYVRHYAPVLRRLAERGHDIELVTEGRERHGWTKPVEALAAQYPQIRLSRMPDVTANPDWQLATRLRQARFYLRFLAREYRGMPALLERTRSRAPKPAIRLGELPVVGPAIRPLLVRAIDVLERSTLTANAFHDFLRSHCPDVVVLTPLVVLKTSQLDLARAAVDLGVRNVFAVASWDNLSSKGELNFTPQHVFVWNQVQQEEARRLHGIPPEHVTITGAQVFDEWFDRQPAHTRAGFCARVGLRPDRPILLYVCSALLEGAPPEPDFVLRWVRHLRASGHAALRDCGILIRPHFKRGEEWARVSFEGLENVVCWPPLGAVPVDATSKADYFDSLYHAAAVVGLNTSAMIEAAIVDRPVHTVLLAEFHGSQEGTVHFHYLLSGPNAVLRAARTLDEHAADLAATLSGHDSDPGRSRRFVRAFVRPTAGVSGTDAFVTALEALAQAPAPAPRRVPGWARLIHPWLDRFATAAADRVERIRVINREEKLRLLEEHRRRKAEARGKSTTVS
jgi:hypothetical protein